MNPQLLAALRCPKTYEPLTLEPREFQHGIVWNGVLRNQSGDAWLIRDGMIDLLDGAAAWNGAQIVNRLPIAAWGYERLWRWNALTLLSGRSLPVREEIAIMQAHVAPQRQGIYLDLACSNGLYGRYLAQATDPETSVVVCLDHSEPMLREAQRRAHELGVQIIVMRGLAENLPFADHSLVGVVCGGSFNEFTNQARVLSEVRRSLSHDGRSFWMQAQRAPSLRGRMLQAMLSPGGVSFPSGDELKRSLTAAGLHVSFDQRDGAVQMIATRGQVITPQ